MVTYTNERMKKALRKYLKKVNKHFKIERVILFGSRARGDYFLDSDVDLIILSCDFDTIPFRERMSRLLEWWDESIDLEVIGYTPEEFERKKKQIGIVKTAVDEGIEVRLKFFTSLFKSSEYSKRQNGKLSQSFAIE